MYMYIYIYILYAYIYVYIYVYIYIYIYTYVYIRALAEHRPNTTPEPNAALRERNAEHRPNRRSPATKAWTWEFPEPSRVVRESRRPAAEGKPGAGTGI